MRVEIKNKAKEVLKNNMWNVFGMILIVWIITSFLQNLPSLFGLQMTTDSTINGSINIKEDTPFGYVWSLIITVLSGLLSFVEIHYILNTLRGNKISYSDSFKAGGRQIKSILFVTLLIYTFTLLGFICLIIPGIIVYFGLVLSYYIMVDNPSMNEMDVIKESWRLMKGEKFNYFVLLLSFMLWFLLCIFIFPLVYVMPYVTLTQAAFYEKVKNAKMQLV